MSRGNAGGWDTVRDVLSNLPGGMTTFLHHVEAEQEVLVHPYLGVIIIGVSRVNSSFRYE